MKICVQNIHGLFVCMLLAHVQFFCTTDLPWPVCERCPALQYLSHTVLQYGYLEFEFVDSCRALPTHDFTQLVFMTLVTNSRQRKQAKIHNKSPVCFISNTHPRVKREVTTRQQNNKYVATGMQVSKGKVTRNQALN